MLSTGNKVVGPSASVALICFFLPWILVSCEGQPIISMSGWQLAVGGTISTSFGTRPIGSSPELFLVLLAAIGCLVLIYVSYQRLLSISQAAYATVGLAVVSLLLLLIKFFTAEQPDQGVGPEIEVALQYGLWGTFLGYIGVIIGAVVDITTAKSQTDYFDLGATRRLDR